MFNKVLAAILASTAILVSTTVFATDCSVNYNVVRVNQKAVAYSGVSAVKAVNNFHTQAVSQHDNYGHNDRIIIKAIAVPVTDFGRDFYYKLEKDIDEDKIVERTTEKVRVIIKDELEGFANKIAEALHRQNANPPPVVPVDPIEPVEPVVEPTTAIDIPADVQALIDKYNCTLCHNDKKAPYGFNFVKMTKKGKPLTLADWYAIEDSIEHGRMPKQNVKMSDAEHKLIEDWIRGVYDE